MSSHKSGEHLSVTGNTPPDNVNKKIQYITSDNDKEYDYKEPLLTQDDHNNLSNLNLDDKQNTSGF